MPLLDDLLDTLPAAPQAVEAVQVGLYWTAVRIGTRIGLASTLVDAACCFAEDVPEMGRLQNLSAQALASRLHSDHPIEASLGLAALNALLPVDETQGVAVNARELLIERGRGRTVAMIGHFNFTEQLRASAGRLWVLELHPTAGDRPASDAPEILPQADVIGLTAATLANHTFEGLARLCPPHALVVMLGPSTPLCPALFDYGVDVLAGARVADPDFVWNAVAQGSALHGKITGLKRFTLTSGRR